MSSETDPLVPTNGDDSQDAEEGTPPPSPSVRRRRKHQFPPLLIALLTFVCIACITIGVIVVWNAEKRRQRPKLLGVNTMAQTNNVTSGCETTVMLMRHCEKYGPLVHAVKRTVQCSYLGLQRAHYMTSLFGTRWPNPSHLFALSPDRGEHDNFRQMQTLTPIATKLGLSINHDYKQGQEIQVARKVFERMASGNSCGKLTVISWTHCSIPALAAALGCGTFNEQSGGCPARFPPDSFDQVWLLKFVYQPATHALSKKYRKKFEPTHEWTMYPTITQMDFDPLENSNKVGDYPDGGKETGGAWLKEL